MYQNISSWVLLILWIIPLIHCDIIKVENETHVYCIDDENKDSTIFFSPPLKKLRITENTIKVFIWENKEWKLMNGSDLLMAPSIKDKIWKGRKSKIIRFIQYSQIFVLSFFYMTYNMFTFTIYIFYILQTFFYFCYYLGTGFRSSNPFSIQPINKKIILFVYKLTI